MVYRYLQGLYRREVLLHILQRIIGGCIVGNDHLVAGRSLLHYLWQKKLMPFSTVVAQYYNGCILMAYDHSGVCAIDRLFILRVVKCIIRRSYFVIALVLMLIKVVTTRPCEYEKAEER